MSIAFQKHMLTDEELKEIRSKLNNISGFESVDFEKSYQAILLANHATVPTDITDDMWAKKITTYIVPEGMNTDEAYAALIYGVCCDEEIQYLKRFTDYEFPNKDQNITTKAVDDIAKEYLAIHSDWLKVY